MEQGAATEGSQQTNRIENVKQTIDTTKAVTKNVKRIYKAARVIASSTTLLAAGSLIIVLMIVMIAVNGSNSNSYSGIVTGIGLSESTMQWLDEVEAEAEAQGVSELVPYIMAVIEVESKGQLPDLMQSSESLGLPPNTLNERESIAQGIRYLASAFALAEAGGLDDPLAIVQSYNFGTSYVKYLINKGKQHSVDVAEEYSRTVVAPSLGNTNGSTYSYVNAVSQASGKTYLYSNGGNFHYASLVKQYLAVGGADIPMGSGSFKDVMELALQFQGNPYVWGGASPQEGFDCSGLIQWVYSQIGINLPRVAVDQWRATVEIPIEEAQAGDLIFFKGTYGAPDYISHVGIYIDETRMYDSNSSGVGYHYHTSPYWSQHFDSVRRIVK